MSADVKSLMRAARAERSGGIQHPFAKYNALGKLTCKLCAAVVGSDALWQAHLLSSVHTQVRGGGGGPPCASHHPHECVTHVCGCRAGARARGRPHLTRVRVTDPLLLCAGPRRCL